MKSKIVNNLYIFTTIIFIGATAQAQDPKPKLDEALSAYNSGSLDDARFALEQALQEIDIAIGQEILAMLPTEMNSVPVKTELDDVNGYGLGFAGVYVNRYYGNENQSVEVEIITDSPLLASLNALLAMPFIGTADPNKKRVKVDGYKALLEKSEGQNGIMSYTIQVPFNQSLLTFTCDGFADDDQVLGMADKISVTNIAKLVQ